MFDIPCVIFAGGRSSRMGEDKALLPFGDFETLTQYQLSRLEKIFKTVYISTKSKDKFNFEANFIIDIKTDNIYAPTAGFLGVFKTIKEDSFFALSVDAPLVSKNEILSIIEADTKDSDATVAKTDSGIQPMCGIYHRSLENEFTKMLQENNHKLGFLLKSAKTTYVNFDDTKAFLNLNNPHEYTKATTIIKDYK